MNDGRPWKRWLINDLRELREEMDSSNWDERPSYRAAVVERFMFVSAYVARKLLESELLTVDVLERDWPIKRFRCVRPLPPRHQFLVSRDLTTWWQPIEDHYDLDNPEGGALRLPALCNLIVHHFAFEVRSADQEVMQIFFNSDRSKAKALNMITFPTYLDFVDDVARDEAIFFTVDRKTNRQLRHQTRRLDLL